MSTATEGVATTDHEPGLMAGVMRLHLLVSAQLEAVTATYGIALADYLVLAVVRRAPDGRTSPSQICDVLHRTSGGMTLTLDRLEASGWLVRSPDPTDRRRVALELTTAGIALAVAVNKALHRWEEDLGLGAARTRTALAALDDLASVLVGSARPISASRQR